MQIQLLVTFLFIKKKHKFSNLATDASLYYFAYMFLVKTKMKKTNVHI